MPIRKNQKLPKPKTNKSRNQSRNQSGNKSELPTSSQRTPNKTIAKKELKPGRDIKAPKRKMNTQRTANKDKDRYEFSIIRVKTSDYVPLDRLNLVDKILMAFKWQYNTNYKEKQLQRKRIRLEQEHYNKVFYLRKYLKKLLQKVPSDATDIKIQIDNIYLSVLDEVLSTGFEEYRVEVIKMNYNYFRLVSNPHVMLKFNTIVSI